MTRLALVLHLLENGCELVSESARHSWWRHPASDTRSALPRHTEIAPSLARKICRDFHIPPVE
jgi:hypothetical protein